MKSAIIVISCFAIVGVFGIIFLSDFDASQVPTGLIDITSADRTGFDEVIQNYPGILSQDESCNQCRYLM